jgi:hypothetical protein
MAEDDLIARGSDLKGFFTEAVVQVVQARGCDASDATVHYVIGLLSDYAHPENLQRSVFERPFTLLLYDAPQTTGADRLHRLRALGDDVLYMSGFFGDHLARRGVELGFVGRLGSRAYDEAASMLRGVRPDAGGPDVFFELSRNFGQFVEVVTEVADVVHARGARGPRGMLDVYERWLKTGSGALAAALSQWGVLPSRTDGTLH